MNLEAFDTSLRSFCGLLKRVLPDTWDVYVQMRVHIFGFQSDHDIRRDLDTDSRSPVRNGVATLNGVISFLKSVETGNNERSVAQAPESASFTDFCNALHLLCAQTAHVFPKNDISYDELFLAMFSIQPTQYDPPVGWNNLNGPVMNGQTTLNGLINFFDSMV